MAPFPAASRALRLPRFPRLTRLTRLALLPILAAAGCSDPEPILRYTYDPYEGEAYGGERPKISIPAGGMGVVTDSRSDTISLIDLAAGQRFATYPVGREPVTIDGPHHVAVDAAAGAVYVALSYPAIAGASGPHAAHGASIVPGYAQKLALDDLRVLGQVRVETNPGDIVISADGKRLVTSHFDLQRALDNPGNIEAARASIAVIDPTAMLPVGSPDPTFIKACVAPHAVVLSKPDGATAYVACYGEDALAIVDLTDPQAEVVRVDVGGDPGVGTPNYGPYAAVMSPDGKTIAVSNTESKDVRFFDVATRAFDPDKTIKTLGGAPYFVAWSADSARLYIPTQQPDTLLIADPKAGAVLSSRTFEAGACDKPHLGELYDHAGDAALFVVCEGDQVAPGRVLKLDPVTLETMESTEVGAYPDALVQVRAPSL